MIVCVCQRVTERDIEHAVREGIDDFARLQARTGVATQCGCCRECANEVFSVAVAADDEVPRAHVA